MAEAQLESQKDVGQGAKGQGVRKQHVPGVGAPGDSREGLGVSHEAPADRTSGHVGQAPSTPTSVSVPAKVPGAIRVPPLLQHAGSDRPDEAQWPFPWLESFTFVSINVARSHSPRGRTMSREYVCECRVP